MSRGMGPMVANRLVANNTTNQFNKIKIVFFIFSSSPVSIRPHFPLELITHSLMKVVVYFCSFKPVIKLSGIINNQNDKIYYR
jgi:hypothetical protein